MEDSPVLHVAMGTDVDRVDVASDDCAVPNAGSFIDLNIANDRGIRGNKGCFG